MIDDSSKRKKINDALAIINDVCLTRDEAYDLFSYLDEYIVGDQPTRGVCALKRIDYEKAVDDYWNGIYKAPHICVWEDKIADKVNEDET